MFGNGLKLRTQETPQWAEELIKQVENDFGISLKDIHWHNGIGYGCYYPRKNMIEVYCSQDENKENILLLLHELSHAVHDIKFGGSIQRYNKKNRIVHGLDFWKTASKIYKKYDMLDYAAQHESYKRGKKYLKTLIPTTFEIRKMEVKSIMNSI